MPCRSLRGQLQNNMPTYDTIGWHIGKCIVSKRKAAEKLKHPIGPKIWKLIESSKSLAVDCISNYCRDMKFEAC